MTKQDAAPAPVPQPVLRNVEQVRQYIVHRQREFVIRLRGYISMTDGNGDIVNMLASDEGMVLVAELTEATMLKLGHAAPLPADDPASKTRRLVSTQRRVK